jgi:glycosyltransferase involved in cell wall biosynthesis
VKLKPKYSVIIPAKNGMPYLRFSVLSVLASDCLELELVISLDGSSDESEDFLAGINDSRLRVVRPPVGLSMSEHWDFAQLQATGDWQIFLGQDDMLMTGFAEAFNYLTDAAKARGLDIVVARRAYVAWPPLGNATLKAMQYWESGELETKPAESFASKALLSGISYHAGPQMYTTTLVSEKLISAIRSKQDGRLVLGHPQDAFLAAALLKEGNKFLFSGRPFSWVGSSIKSAGLAIASSGVGGEVSSLASEYLYSVVNSNSISYHSSVDFRHAVNSRYFLDALSVVWPEIFGTKRFQSRIFRILVDSHSWSVLSQNKKDGVALSQIFFFPGLNSIKALVGLIWIARGKMLSIAHRVGGLVLSTMTSRYRNFKSVTHASDPGTLFDMAMSFSSSYSTNNHK